MNHILRTPKGAVSLNPSRVNHVEINANTITVIFSSDKIPQSHYRYSNYDEAMKEFEHYQKQTGS